MVDFKAPKFQELSFKDLLLLQAAGGWQSGGQTFTVEGGVADVGLTDDKWASKGFGVDRSTPWDINGTIGLNVPIYVMEGPKGHQSGAQFSFGATGRLSTPYSLYSGAANGTLTAGEDVITDDQETLLATVDEKHAGIAASVSWIQNPTTDITKEEKAVADAKKAVDDAKKAVTKAEAAVGEAKKALSAPQAAVDEKQAVVDGLKAQIGVVGDDPFTPGTGLAGKVQTLTAEIATENEIIAAMPTNTNARQKAVDDANAALEPKKAELKALEKALAEAQISLVTAEAALTGPKRVLLAATSAVTEAETAVTNAKAKLTGDPEKVAGAKEKLRVAKVALEDAEEAFKANEGRTPENAGKVREAKEAVKTAKGELDEALGLKNVLKEAEKALEAAKDGNDAFTLSRAGFRYARQWGVTKIDPMSAEGLNVERGAPATSFEPFTTARDVFDFEFVFNLPTLPVDGLLQIGWVHYSGITSSPVVNLEGGSQPYGLSSKNENGNSQFHIGLGVEY